MLVFANKQDLQFALEADQVMETLKLSEIADRTWNIQACSAFTKEGLSDGMEWLIKTISEKQKKWVLVYLSILLKWKIISNSNSMEDNQVQNSLK